MPKNHSWPEFHLSIPPRASEVTGTGTDERRHPRVQLPIPAEVSCEPLKRFRQAAHLRNVSAGGAFFYALMNPRIGTIMKLDFVVKTNGGELQISSEGSVVRTESKALGEQNGVAIEFTRLELGAW
jgi:hypothetical protein